jgi:hypothetical protein
MRSASEGVVVGSTLLNDGGEVVVVRNLHQRMVALVGEHVGAELVAKPGEQQRACVWRAAVSEYCVGSVISPDVCTARQ